MTETKPYFYNEQGNLVIPVIAIPFGDEKHKDLQGDWFHKDTDIGRYKNPISYLDHNKLITRYPELKDLPGIDDAIGEAEKGLTTEEGIVYNVIVDEHYRYQNMLKKLAEKRMLYASTTPFQRSVKKDEKSGRIDRWEVSEVALTWIPANTDAELYMKSIILEELNPMEEKDTTVVETQTEVPNQAAAESSTTAASESPITDAVSKILEAQPAEKSVADMFADLTATLEKSVELQVNASNERLTSIEKSLSDITTALPLLAQAIANSLKSTVADTTQKSALERVVEKSVTQKFQQGAPGQPSPTAPGRDRKASFGGKAN